MWFSRQVTGDVVKRYLCGVCWLWTGSVLVVDRQCAGCGQAVCLQNDPHTFTTPDDAYALEQALVRDERIKDFRTWCVRNHLIYLDDYLLHAPEQRCQLIIDFYKGNGK
jgi:ferredoxin